MNPPSAHRALYSLHDVTPAKEALVFQALAHLRSLGLTRLGLLVVPDFHARADLRLHPQFCAQLCKSLLPGDEILLHGYYHLADAPPQNLRHRLKAAALSAGEGEFHDLQYAEAAERIARGLAVIEETLHVRPRGFVAPAWLQNAETRQAVADAGLDFCEDQLRIFPSRGRAIPSPAASFASRTPLRLWGSIAATHVTSRFFPRFPVSRLAIHPNDYRSRHLQAAISRTVGQWQASTIASSYQEVLA